MKKIIALIAVLSATSAMAELDWFAALDKNADGKVTLDEWIENNKRNRKQEFNEARSIATFQAKDTNGDGSLSREELLTKPLKNPVNTPPPKLLGGIYSNPHLFFSVIRLS